MSELKKDLFADILDAPKEHYTFRFEPSQLTPVEKAYIGGLIKRMILSAILGIYVIVCGIFLDRWIIGFGVGMLLVTLILHIKNLRISKALYAKAKENYPKTVYDYSLYNGFMMVWISAENAIRQMRIALSEIQKAKIISDLLVMEIDGQLFLMKKEELREDSYFLSIAQRRP